MTARYFPQFWNQTRPYAKTLKERMASAALAGGIPAANEVLFREIVQAAARAGLSPQSMMAGGLLAREAMGAQTLAQWELDGARVWDYAPSLVEALRWSEPGDLQLADVLPFLDKAAYFHFGPQTDWLLDGRWPVEGILVLAPLQGFLRVVLVARPTQAWTLPEANSFQMLRFPLETTARLPFAAAVEAAVQLDLDDIEQARRAMQTGSQELGGAEAADVLSQRQEQNAPLYTKALRLLGGALAYAQAYPEDSREDWQEGTPAKWVQKAALPGKEGPRSESKLRAMGFWRVRRVGDEFEAADKAQRQGHVGPSAHWRKGHWRNQAHGPQLSLRKLIWIRPVRVLGDGKDAAEALRSESTDT